MSTIDKLVRGMTALSLAAGLMATAGEASAQSCTPPRILFVVDASSSMTAQIQDPNGPITKWEAAVAAVEAVLVAYPNEAEYGLMMFPGAAGACSTGEVVVDVAAGTAPQIIQTLAAKQIPGGNQTPAGQTLMEASSYPLITDPSYANNVIFVTDGYQYCSINGGQACVTQTDCQLMGLSNCPTCLPSQPDGCYCVQDWTVLGASALAAQNVDTFAVGFGEQVNFQALNQTAVAGNTALAGCDPMATVPSCYYQASQPADLHAALASIVTQVVTETCIGPCSIEGTRTCELDGWSDCVAPSEVSCEASCGIQGVQNCVMDTLTECSSEPMCGGGGMGGSGGMGGNDGTGGSGLGTTGSGGMTGSGGGDDPVIDEDGGCGCRVPGREAPSDRGSLALLALAVGLGLSRRRGR